jgi:drug/metabolite transporter (DMT)-like permease
MDWSATTPLGWAMVLYLSILCSVVAYLLYVDAVRELKPLRTAIFINLNPLAGVLGGVLLLGERLSPVQLLGGLIVLVSIFLVNRRAGRS